MISKLPAVMKETGVEGICRAQRNRCNISAETTRSLTFPSPYLSNRYLMMSSDSSMDVPVFGSIMKGNWLLPLSSLALGRYVGPPWGHG